MINVSYRSKATNQKPGTKSLEAEEPGTGEAKLIAQQRRGPGPWAGRGGRQGQARQSTWVSRLALGERELVGEYALGADGEAAHDEAAAQALPEARRALHASERATRLQVGPAHEQTKRYIC